MPSARIQVDDREFTRTLRQYSRISRREIPDIVNTKAFFIARRAVIETHKADKSMIKTSLGTILKRKGGGRILKLAKADKRDMSLAEAILRARAYRAGREQPDKTAIGALIENLIAARMRSIAFLKSGWLPAIKALEKLVKSKSGVARTDRSPKQYGKAKGSAIPAHEGFRVSATIINAASADRDRKAALDKFGTPALARAFAFETKSMEEYMEEKLKKAAQSVGIRTS